MEVPEFTAAENLFAQHSVEASRVPCFLATPGVCKCTLEEQEEQDSALPRSFQLSKDFALSVHRRTQGKAPAKFWLWESPHDSTLERSMVLTLQADGQGGNEYFNHFFIFAVLKHGSLDPNDIEAMPTTEFPGAFRFRNAPFVARAGYCGPEGETAAVYSACAFAIFLSKCCGELINPMEWTAYVVPEVEPVPSLKGGFKIVEIGEKLLGGGPVPPPPATVPTKKLKFDSDSAWGRLTKAAANTGEVAAKSRQRVFAKLEVSVEDSKGGDSVVDFQSSDDSYLGEGWSKSSSGDRSDSEDSGKHGGTSVDAPLLDGEEGTPAKKLRLHLGLGPADGGTGDLDAADSDPGAQEAA